MAALGDQWCLCVKYRMERKVCFIGAHFPLCSIVCLLVFKKKKATQKEATEKVLKYFKTLE
ncbi:hypothetical protein P872_03135 [Rhodonellum psychrophilum GCM71 = DSM 17998]|uniref:Uncharacterized protein n=2 Tax=Rhodonellum TaxID=336827 RepID=U5C0L6_9BACT|nr:hypothetical protein P872_03135 [Rhodonellum psychrophilum GCM71 = DSM 17998]SDY50257.1 hypothetical protein SAMN05444412_101350 [Rhodonellum ikkaensis]